MREQAEECSAAGNEGGAEAMKRVATTIRCVPRVGLENTDVRLVDLDLPGNADDQALFSALNAWFAEHGIADAVYDIATDDDGFFAVVNDEAYLYEWGTPLL